MFVSVINWWMSCCNYGIGDILFLVSIVSLVFKLVMWFLIVVLIVCDILVLLRLVLIVFRVL